MSDAPPRVEVYGESELLRRLAAGESHYRSCISIGNPRALFRPAAPGEYLPQPISRSFERLLRLSFHDAETRQQTLPGRHLRLPSRRDIRRVISFYRDTKDRTDGWTIHCWAGVSRSTAVALGLLYLECGDEARAAVDLQHLRPEALPNLMLVRLFDDLLGSKLVRAAERLHALRFAALQAEFEAMTDAAIEELEAAH